jgi:hypothetical protein
LEGAEGGLIGAARSVEGRLPPALGLVLGME